MAKFQPAYINTMRFERSGKDGPVYSEVKGDVGGATNSGIALSTYQEHFPSATKDVLKNMSEHDVFTFYQTYIWKTVYNAINEQPMANYIFDMTVNHGAHKCHQMVQECINTCKLHGNTINAFVDGQFGARTLEMTNFFGVKELLPKLRERRIELFENIVKENPEEEKFLDGWLTRAKEA